MERSDQERESKKIGLGWSEQSKYNHSIADWVDKREVRILDQIGLY